MVKFQADTQFLYNQARETAFKGKPELALEMFKKVASQAPQMADVYVEMANCQDCLGKSEEAIASYNKALNLDPHHADAWFNKGEVLKKMGQTKEGDQCVEKAVHLYVGD